MNRRYFIFGLASTATFLTTLKAQGLMSVLHDPKELFSLHSRGFKVVSKIKLSAPIEKAFPQPADFFERLGFGPIGEVTEVFNAFRAQSRIYDRKAYVIGNSEMHTVTYWKSYEDYRAVHDSEIVKKAIAEMKGRGQITNFYSQNDVAVSHKVVQVA